MDDRCSVRGLDVCGEKGRSEAEEGRGVACNGNARASSADRGRSDAFKSQGLSPNEDTRAGLAGDRCLAHDMRLDTASCGDKVRDSYISPYMSLV